MEAWLWAILFIYPFCLSVANGRWKFGTFFSSFAFFRNLLRKDGDQKIPCMDTCYLVFVMVVMMLKLKRELEKERAFLAEDCLTIVAPSH